MWLVLRLCTSVQKFKVGPKTPSHFLLQLQNRPTSLASFVYLHVCFVNTGSVLTPELRMRHYVICEFKLVQDERLKLKRIEMFINDLSFFFIPQLALQNLRQNHQMDSPKMHLHLTSSKRMLSFTKRK